ncbi:Polynucleotide 5'-hydroxyl-kinase NOL9 [Strongyloides ratti]|uniref:Polynucleotide 5'-hydroxyl-kinase NOL9 n=1 Tax=Strongyloides ratti TaxID=34506 RepID=A0A090MU43_STRRB|nr:Polynucleotide 5'-hydroxyl-kinase NOL9 [Strongyloides ratti]CEF61978.1 Polynucleotide 5'-hydroxyl-kinase NOL9 [Strongyloides ratti]
MHNVEIFNLSDENGLIMIFHQSENVKKNEYILFGGFCEIAVIYGRIMIQGYKIDSTNSSISEPFFISSFRKSREQITITNITEKLEIDDGKNQNTLLELFPYDKECIYKLCKSIKNNSAVLHLKRNETPLLLKLKALYPNYLHVPGYAIETKLFRDAAILNKQRYVRDNYYLSYGVQAKLKEIIQKLSNVKTGKVIKILTYGSSENGLSALNKYIANSCLNIKNCNVYWGELNVEQPEFTPPGVVSLTHVTEPILTDSYLHVNPNIVYSLFYGKNYIENMDPKYITVVSALISEFVKITNKDKSLSYLLILNTMPLRGSEKRDFITTIVSISSPDDLFLCCQGKPFKYIPTNFDSNKIIVVEAPIDVNGNKRTGGNESYENDRGELKRIPFSAYFARYITNLPKTAFALNLIQWPFYQICFSQIKLHIQDKFITFESETFDDALNVVLVALCTMTEVNNGGFYTHNLNDKGSLQLLNPNFKGFYKRINHRKTNLLFVGYGIITNIDKKRELFDIFTPISREKLLDVNVLVKPNFFNIPSEMLFLQHDCEYSYSKGNYNDKEWFAWNKDLSRIVDINDKTDYRNYNDIDYKRIRES